MFKWFRKKRLKCLAHKWALHDVVYTEDWRDPYDEYTHYIVACESCGAKKVLDEEKYKHFQTVFFVR